MKITAIRLKTHTFDAMRDFYTKTLDFPLIDESDTSFTLKIGETALTFEADTSDTFVYHFAISIPHQVFAEAREWLMARTDLLIIEGSDIVNWTAWDADAIYFRDPAGNIGEFIASRHLDLPHELPFSPALLYRVCEIGISLESVPKDGDAVQKALNLPTWDEGGDIFHALGDPHGLLLMVENERNWFPTTDCPANPIYTHITFESDKDETYAIAGYPYTIVMQSVDRD